MRFAVGFLLVSLLVAWWLRRRLARRGLRRVAIAAAAIAATPAVIFCAREGVRYAPGPEASSGPRRVGEAVVYRRIAREAPRRLVAHVAEVDLRAPGVRLAATRPDRPEADLPYDARTTSAFVAQTGALVAVNGDFFEPWRPSLLDEYPRPGDPVRPLGTTWSSGAPVRTPGQGAAHLVLGPGPHAAFGAPAGPGGDVVGGLCMLVRGGAPADLGPCRSKKPWQLHPRTAVGLSAERGRLWLVVVDGRQPRYSAGAELEEVAALLVDLGAREAMSLDGGGSSAMALRAEDGAVELVSSPIAGGIPGRERPVANHVGVFVDP